MKKFFIVSTILLLFIGILWVIWFFAFRQQTPKSTPQKEPDDTTVQEQQQRATAPIRNITSTPVRAFAVVPGEDNVIRIWDTQDETIYDISFHGTNRTQQKHLPLANIKDVRFSPDANGVIVRTDDALYTYFLDSQDLQRLNEHIDYAIWAQDSQRIIYKFYDPQTRKRTLNIARPNQSWTELATLPYRRVKTTQLPQSIFIAFWPQPSAFEISKLSTVPSIGPTTTEEVFDGLYGADYSYAPDGKQILISSTLKRGGTAITLGKSNAHGGEYVNFNLPTFVDKTVWSKDGKTVYYAIPNDFPPHSVLPNDYQQQKFFTRDTFWKLDTTTGKSKRIIPLDDITEKLDATHLHLSPAEDTLLFINRINGLLYTLAL